MKFRWQKQNGLKYSKNYKSATLLWLQTTSASKMQTKFEFIFTNWCHILRKLSFYIAF